MTQQQSGGWNGEAEGQRKGGCYSNPGSSELRHWPREWEDGADSRAMKELNFPGPADWWCVRNEGEKKVITTYEVLSMSQAWGEVFDMQHPV